MARVWRRSPNILLLELALGLVYAVLGYLAFRLLEREAKRRGAFETF